MNDRPLDGPVSCCRTEDNKWVSILVISVISIIYHPYWGHIAQQKVNTLILKSHQVSLIIICFQLYPVILYFWL